MILSIRYFTKKILNFLIIVPIRHILFRSGIDRGVVDELIARAIQDSSDFAQENARNAMIFPEKEDLWQYCLREAGTDGLFLEFGVFKGYSINQFAKILPNIVFHGFDSFLGLPSQWEGMPAAEGHFTTHGKLPKVRRNVKLYQGWFDKTIPRFLEIHPSPQSVSFLHVDCDSYSSTVTILDMLQPRLGSGVIIVFDEYFGYPNWRSGEHKAWEEYTQKHSIEFDIIALSHHQLAVKLH
jgi:predicted O-methyltransferase YrrM